MRKQFLIIGLDFFGKRALELLFKYDLDIILIDKDEEVINQYKQRVFQAYIADVTRVENLEKIIPATIDVAVVDVGKNVEASTLIANTLSNMKIPDIVVKADSDQHARILKLVGATQIVLPNMEAANRIIPRLVNSNLRDYFSMSKDLIIAEVEVPGFFQGRTLMDINLRKNYHVNMIAYKNAEEKEYHYFSADYQFREGDSILIAGNEENINSFIHRTADSPEVSAGGFFQKLFKKQ